MRSEAGSVPFFGFIISIVVLAMLAAMGSAKADVTVQGPAPFELRQD